MSVGKEDTKCSDLWRGISEIAGKDEILDKISKGFVLKVKAGFDPTAPDIHFGHVVLLRKLRQFQDLGHHVYFIVGDFTAMIGDPTGKNAARPTLDADVIIENAKTYQEQALKVLDSMKTTFIYNSEWFGEMTASDLIRLTQKYTVARILERDDFQKRYQNNLPISLHEFIYPLLQGWDSVQLKSDLEIGGNDQKFNLLVGRELQKQEGMAPQAILTMPLLVGLDGEKKMSKSLNNYIAIQDEPEVMFGKIMSISDDNLWTYMTLLSHLSLDAIDSLKQQVHAGLNPRDVKMQFGQEMVEQFYDAATGLAARQAFIDKYQQKKAPELPLIDVPFQSDFKIANLLKELGLTKSTSESLRLLQQGAVKINGEKIDAHDWIAEPGIPYLIQVGKHRFMHIQLI
ncbi:MAG: tyrosine--tRNA ligase [Gammaproteobacteria bacterium]|nr:tyrosine--tRNA ligase [Gammaproteobacteria bacterium]